MIWWLWLLLGLALLGAELVTPGAFVAFFFGISALVMAGIAAFDVLPQWLEWLTFTGLAVAALLLFRRWFQRRLTVRSEPPVDSLVGEIGVLLEDLPVRGVGKIEVRGTPWTAHNSAERELPRGQRCRVEKVDGLALWVRAE